MQCFMNLHVILHRGRANLLSIVLILVYVPPKGAPINVLLKENLSSTFLRGCPANLEATFPKTECVHCLKDPLL